MRSSHLSKLQNLGTAQCARCVEYFYEDDIIATTTSKRYCYDCAIKVKLVTGKIKKDLKYDKLIPTVLNHIELIGKKLEINDEFYKLAILLVTTAIEKKGPVSKNTIGLACASIFLAHKIKKQFISKDSLPISKRTLEINVISLQKNLSLTNIHTLSEKICELKH